MKAYPYTGKANTHDFSACIVNLIYCELFISSSCVITTNSDESNPQPLFFERVSAKKSSKRNAVLWGAAPLPATFEKVDETFKLSNP